jgi:signal transduction histidine kinase
VHWAAATLNASSLLGEIADTTTRISQLVDAVKSYSQMDRAARQRIDVHDGLASTLVMLGHKLRDVEVARSFGDDVPELDAYPGELNQVWTNLIDNAIDAMDGRGSLAITTRLDADDLVIDIADTGPGMSEQVKARAFEPFFTTKDVGKGTGLGLDISRRIVVDRHGGEITFDSSESGTTAHVRLPLTG